MRFGVGLVVLLALLLPYAYFMGFGHLADFDDEGTLMITLRDLIQGARLYDDAYALYGPFYFLTVGKLFTALHVPLTHDVARGISIVSQMVCSGLLAALSYRLSRSIAAGLFTCFASVLLLRYLVHSPLHPQEICLAMLAAVPHLFLWLDQRPDRARTVLAALGAILAALLLTKINVGLFAILAVGLTVLGLTRAGGWILPLRAVAAAVTVVLPVALMWPLTGMGWVRLYAALSTAGIGAALLAWLGAHPRPLLTPARWAWLLGAMALVAAITLGATLAGGTSAFAILDTVVLQNSRLVRNWWIELPVTGWEVGLALLAPCAAAAHLLWPDRARAPLAVLKLVFGLVCVLGVALEASGLRLWQNDLMFPILMPFSFLLLVPRAGAPVDAGRLSLGLIAAIMALYAFPVAGTQVVIAEVLVLAAAPVLLLDGIAALPGALPASLIRLRWPLYGLASLALLAGLGLETRQAYWVWGSRVASGLPGAELVRMMPVQKQRVRWVLDELSQCASFYTFPGQMSFYFWTGAKSPTALNNNDVLALLSPPQQERVVRQLDQVKGLCILQNRDMLEAFDRGQLAARPPLLDFIEDNFAPVAENGPLSVLVRKHL